MTNTLRSVAALLAWPAIVAAVLATGCSAPRQAAPARSLPSQVEMLAMSSAADRDAEALCSRVAEPDSDLWWECTLAYTSLRCSSEGWCE